MKRLVVDTNVIISAGMEDDPDKRSYVCRKTLEAIKSGDYHFVLGDDLFEELDKHRSDLSSFSSDWLETMISEKRVCGYDVYSEETRLIKKTLRSAIPTREIFKIVEKDFHLIEAAVLTDKLIISVETHSRDHFRNYSQVIQVLREICWMNPADPDEKVVAWLKAGAKHSACRKLVPHDPKPKPRRRKPKDR